MHSPIQRKKRSAFLKVFLAMKCSLKHLQERNWRTEFIPTSLLKWRRIAAQARMDCKPLRAEERRQEAVRLNMALVRWPPW